MAERGEEYRSKNKIVWMVGKDCVNFEKMKILPFLNLTSSNPPYNSDSLSP